MYYIHVFIYVVRVMQVFQMGLAAMAGAIVCLCTADCFVEGVVGDLLAAPVSFRWMLSKSWKFVVCSLEFVVCRLSFVVCS